MCILRIWLVAPWKISCPYTSSDMKETPLLSPVIHLFKLVKWLWLLNWDAQSWIQADCSWTTLGPLCPYPQRGVVSEEIIHFYFNYGVEWKKSKIGVSAESQAILLHVTWHVLTSEFSWWRNVWCCFFTLLLLFFSSSWVIWLCRY